MEYIVIARRYRPRRFDEVVGQEATASTLRNAILHDRLAHAYLFCGPRGVGKTSMARIFARALNCPVASDRSRPREEWGIPCNDCEVCRAVHAGEDIDVVEMDGASHRGIDEIRDIIDNVKFMPIRSGYKIYIVDEVHMLTREAFNALLKLLEEPPAHVKFILATTEPQKIPDTVLSRCQRFDFHPIGESDIVRRLEQICGEENVKPEPGLLERIARYGKGGLRDAQTLLDQLISFSEEALGLEDLERITGRLPDHQLDELLSALQQRDSAQVLGIVEGCFREGNDPAMVLEQVIERLRALLGERIRTSEAPPGGRGDTKSRRETRTKGQEDAEGDSSRFSLDWILGSIQILHETASRLKSSPYPQLAVEISLVKLARMEDPRALDEALEFLRRFEEKGIGQGPAPAPRNEPPPPEESVSSVEHPTRASRQQHVSEAPEQQACDFRHLRSLWDQILIEFRSRYPQLQGFLKNLSVSEAAAGTVHVGFSSDFHFRQMKERRRVEMLESLIREITGAPWQVKPELIGEAAGGEKPPAQDGKSGPSLREDPIVKKSLDLFRGKIV